MTKKELSRYYYLEREIRQDREEIENLNAKLTHITQVLSDMPKGSPQRDRIDEIIDELARRDNLLHEKIARAEKERNKILQYINSIDDSLIRLIIQYRYLNLLTWTKVACFVGGNNTPDGVRMLSDRYILSH